MDSTSGYLPQNNQQNMPANRGITIRSVITNVAIHRNSCVSAKIRKIPKISRKFFDSYYDIAPIKYNCSIREKEYHNMVTLFLKRMNGYFLKCDGFIHLKTSGIVNEDHAYVTHAVPSECAVFIPFNYDVSGHLSEIADIYELFIIADPRSRITVTISGVLFSTTTILTN